MRLGGKIVERIQDPDSWIAAIKKRGFSAAFCPPSGRGADDEKIRAYAEAAVEADVVIAEVTAWCNPLSPDEEERREAVERCEWGLELAERIGARCCLSSAGSPGHNWDGPDAINLTDDTFELVVESTRSIIDAVKPTRTFYTVEVMPWIYPDSADSYLRLIKAIDRKQFGAHFDPVNLVYSPQIHFNNGAMIRDFVSKLGSHIKSCHAKDTLLGQELTTHIDEVRAGLGNLDYTTLLRELDKLDPDMPLMIEHLKTDEEVALASSYIRSVAKSAGVEIR